MIGRLSRGWRFWRGREPGSSRSVAVTAAAASDVGRRRERNEDYFAIADLAAATTSGRRAETEHRLTKTASLLVVADGMGGHAAGEVASEMAANLIVAHLADAWREARGRSPVRLRRALVDAIELANREIYEYAGDHPELKSMGTTVTAAALLGDHLYVGHVGDSRAYLMTHGTVRRITTDHSLVQHLLDTGALTPEQAAASPQRNVLLRALGPSAEVTADVSYHRVEPGDALVLCSDGLWSLVGERELEDIIGAEPTLAAACKRLVASANDRGGHDNITVLLARFDADGHGDGPARREAASAG